MDGLRGEIGLVLAQCYGGFYQDTMFSVKRDESGVSCNLFQQLERQTTEKAVHRL